MDRSLIITDIKGWSHEDWLRYRKRGVGASEAGAVMGLSEYTSCMELFYDKIGDHLNVKTDNIAMFMGRFRESGTGKLWQYWEGDEDSIVRNFPHRKIRKAQRINGYINNPKYPWLFVSLDYKANKNVFRGKSYGEGAVEIKNMSGFEIEKWEHGIPPVYIIQLMVQMLVCGFEWGEIFVEMDGRRFACHHFEANKEIFQHIIEATHDFWIKVEEGRKIRTQIYHAKQNFQMAKVEDLQAKLVQIEPEPDASEGLEKFLKAKYLKGTAGEKEGSITAYDWGQKHLQAKELIKVQNKIILEAENHIKSEMKDFECLTFGQDGRIYWSNDITGKRVFRNKLKVLQS